MYHVRLTAPLFSPPTVGRGGTGDPLAGDTGAHRGGIVSAAPPGAGLQPSAGAGASPEHQIC